MNIHSQNFVHRITKAKELFSIWGLVLVLSFSACGQTAPTEDIRETSPPVHAITGADVVVAPGEKLENATLVIRGSKVAAVGTGVTPPADAYVWDMEGQIIYPGFIDAHSGVGMQNPREELDRGARSWNEHIRAQLSADQEYEKEEDGREQLRAQGFTAANAVPPLGVFRGQTAVMSLVDGELSDRVVKSGAAHSVRIESDYELGFDYPTSPMGDMALIRQTLHDAEWYQRAHDAYRQNPEDVERPETNPALAALQDVTTGDQQVLFEANTEHQLRRSVRIHEEFDVPAAIRGSGHEYRIRDVLSDHDVPLIIPVDYPEKPDVDTPEQALQHDLQELRHWYQAPKNPKMLADAGVDFALTADGLESPDAFRENLRKAVRLGLDPEDALAALTTRPAEILGIDDSHGTLEAGQTANLVIADDKLFTTGGKILDVWIDGKRFHINEAHPTDPRGEWELSSAEGRIDGTLELGGSLEGLEGTFTIDGEETELNRAVAHDQPRRFNADIPGEAVDLDGTIRISGSISDDEASGWAELPAGERVQWTAERTAAHEEEEDSPEQEVIRDFELTERRPSMEYGREAIPEQPEHVVVRNATVWTMGPQGKLENADLLISGGEVAEAGADLDAPGNAVEIDGEDKHVSPGLIDAHLHNGIDGVNEFGHAIVPEVRMGDVLNINNIWTYRHLAGGLTTAHLMHGSANPVGGQNQHVKMRWGHLPEEMKLEGAPRTVKFALGENVTGSHDASDYPATRMGTEQIVKDHFRQARDYRARWQEWEATGEGLPPRKDLRMEALLDILDDEILIQSHSYRQDEILMLTRLAEEFDMQLDAFHHGVEAYKVAPELAEHGAAAVVWSDWGSFKQEAYDATVYNARLLSEAGVLTSLHSDRSRIASQMNWEAGKMVRAGMDPEEALALITINTAKVLGIDDRVGSLEPGKDADFVLWSASPLSKATKAEQTWVDGRKYFDLEDDAERRRQVEEERSRLIELLLAE